MNTQNLVISLIQQDLKHHQLTLGLEKLGLGSSVHHLQIMDLVSGLMEVPEKAADRWSDTYMAFMEEAVGYPVTQRGEKLEGLAEACWRWLRADLLMC